MEVTREILSTSVVCTTRMGKINWTDGETELLIELCSQSTYVNKKLSKSLTAHDKNQFWIETCERINSISRVHRSIDQIKKKWQDMKSITKKKHQNHSAECRKTGGGPAAVLPLGQWELKILKSIPECSVMGVPDGTDTFLANNPQIATGSSCSMPTEDACCKQVPLETDSNDGSDCSDSTWTAKKPRVEIGATRSTLSNISQATPSGSDKFQSRSTPCGSTEKLNSRKRKGIATPKTEPSNIATRRKRGRANKGTADAYDIISKQNNLLEDLNASICKLNESIIILTREISDLKSENSQNLLFNF